MSVYKLHGTSGTSQDSISSLDIQFDGHIVGWSINGYAETPDSVNDGFIVEASFLSVNSIESNDARGSICMAAAKQGFLTTGGGPVVVNESLSGLSIPVTAGERVHLHTKVVGGVTSLMTVYLYVADTADSSLRRRR